MDLHIGDQHLETISQKSKHHKQYHPIIALQTTPRKPMQFNYAGAVMQLGRPID